MCLSRVLINVTTLTLFIIPKLSPHIAMHIEPKNYDARTPFTLIRINLRSYLKDFISVISRVNFSQTLLAPTVSNNCEKLLGIYGYRSVFGV